jgi:hypothetical protein
MNKTSFMVILVTVAIFSLAITHYSNAQQGVIPDNSISCPEGHDCHCIPASGNYVDTTSGFRINDGCSEGTGIYNSQVGAGQ